LQIRINKDLKTLECKEEYRNCRNINENWGRDKSGLLKPSIDTFKRKKNWRKERMDN